MTSVHKAVLLHEVVAGLTGSESAKTLSLREPDATPPGGLASRSVSADSANAITDTDETNGELTDSSVDIDVQSVPTSINASAASAINASAAPALGGDKCRTSEANVRHFVAPREERHRSVPVFADCTIGGGGHARAIAESLDGKVTIVGLDRDPDALKRADEALSGKAERIILANRNFRQLDQVLDAAKIAEVDMILLDLGISSDQLESAGRGFTFSKDEPLMMTMGDPASYPFTARTIVNEWKEEDIANVIFGYGEERFARRIARAIVGYRGKKMIETSGELAEIIRMAVPQFYRRGRINPATRTFQALRIAVNDELGALKQGLAKGYERLAKGGRMAVISFHSLEDGIVKEFYKEKVRTDGAVMLTKKPIRPSEQEVSDNPRSRSAKLRIIEKTV